MKNSTFSIRFFGSSAPINEEQNLFIKRELDEFLSSWNSHGTPLSAKSEILFDRWVCVVADEEQEKAGGCSLDRLFRKVQDIGASININLTDRTLLTYLEDSTVHTVHFQEFINLVNTQSLPQNTKILDTTVAHYQDFVEKSWIPADESWLKVRLSKA